ncbi:MAG: hypothetical protein U1F35_12605 [Steroidobacteraceae bacterium]
MRVLYSLITRLAAPVAFASVLWRSITDPAYRTGWAERFGFGERLQQQGCIWVHAVSDGRGRRRCLAGARPARTPAACRWS